MSVSSGAATVPTGEQWIIKSGDHEATIAEVGGGLGSYRVAGVDVVDGYGEGEICPFGAGQILAPWPNRIRDGRYTFQGESHQLSLTEPARHNAIHGLVQWVRWQLVHLGDDRVVIAYVLPAQPGYPWSLRIQTTWSVGPAGLTAEHEVTNLSATGCPFGFSVHPYLTVPGVAIDDLTLKLPARNRLLVDGRLLPIGAARVAGGDFDFTEGKRLGAAILDTAFGDVERDDTGGSTVTLSTVDGRGVRVWADAGFGWWQIFTSDTLPGDRYRRSVAIEPMTCPPDAFRSGRDLLVLEPHQPWRGTWGAGMLPVDGAA